MLFNFSFCYSFYILFFHFLKLISLKLRNYIYFEQFLTFVCSPFAFVGRYGGWANEAGSLKSLLGLWFAGLGLGVELKLWWRSPNDGLFLSLFSLDLVKRQKRSRLYLPQHSIFSLSSNICTPICCCLHLDYEFISPLIIHHILCRIFSPHPPIPQSQQSITIYDYIFITINTHWVNILNRKKE